MWFCTVRGAEKSLLGRIPARPSRPSPAQECCGSMRETGNAAVAESVYVAPSPSGKPTQLSTMGTVDPFPIISEPGGFCPRPRAPNDPLLRVSDPS